MQNSTLFLEAKIQEITVQCEKEEFVELLENLDQNETNFDYNTGKSLTTLNTFSPVISPVFQRFLTVLFRYLPS